jgi:multidrug transporter EmrE-like cation transporter
MDTSRYQLVDSLYGPGTVGAWLLTLCAILISWTLNTSSRRKDTSSVDFVGALLLPMVAVSHLVFQVARLPFSVAETITAQNVELQKYASAMEAPLNICETFSIAALLLAVFCGPWWSSDPKWKRLGLVLVAGLLSWGRRM